MKLFMRIVSIVILAAMSACQLDNPLAFLQKATATPTLTLVPTAEPTATPTPQPTATPTPPPSARLDQAYQLFMVGDLDASAAEYQNAINFSSDPVIHSEALAMLGRIALLQEKDIIALENFRKAIELDNNPDLEGMAHFYLAQIYNSLLRYEEAAAEYDLYLSSKPDILAGYINEQLGDALTNAGRYQEANQAYANAISITGSKDINLDLKVAKNLISVLDYVGALDRLNYIFNNSTDEYTLAQVDLLVGQIYLSQGEVATAYERFQDAVDHYPRAYDFTLPWLPWSMTTRPSTNSIAD